MRYMLRLVYVAFVILAVSEAVLAGEPAKGNRDKDANLLRKTERLWTRAIEAGNGPMLRRILSPSFVDISWTGHLRTRDSLIDNLDVTRHNVTSQSIGDMRIRQYGDVGIVRGLNTVTGKSFGKAEIRFTEIFVKRGGRFRAVAAQETLVR